MKKITALTVLLACALFTLAFVVLLMGMHLPPEKTGNLTEAKAVALAVDNPYNPYGSRFYSATGAPNADGSPRLTGAPQTMSIGDMLLADGGPETIRTTNRMHRVLAGLQGRRAGGRQLHAHAAAGAALHDLHERLVQRVDVRRLDRLVDLDLVALQQLVVVADHAAHGAQWHAEAAVRERVVELRDFDRRQRERAEQRRGVERRLLLETESLEHVADRF